MKKIFLILFIFSISIAKATNWSNSFEEGQKMALASNKLMIIDFWAKWCGPCVAMEHKSWNDPEVEAMLESYVPVKIDIDTHKALADQYGIRMLPNICIVDGNGKVVYSFFGYNNPEELKTELMKFALSTAFLSSELINQFKNPCFSSELRLAQKYFDYSLYVDKNIKNNITQLGLSYLGDAKKDLVKKDAHYKEKMQKIKLYQLFDYAYKFNFEKLDKKLNADFQESAIAAGNSNVYYFLKFLTAKALKSDNLQAMQQKIGQLEDFDYFIKKADVILSKQF